MERRVQFEAGVDRAGRSNTGNPPKGQPASRTDQRKPTLEKQAQPGKPRPAIGFEDYLKKKPSRGEKKPDFEKGPPLKPPVPRQRARTEKPQQTRPVDKPSSLKKPSHIAEPLQDVAVEPREKEELSLENIFDSRLAKEDNPRAADHFVAHEGDTEDVLSPLANRSAVDKRQLIIEHASGYHSHTAMAPQRMATVGASPERSPGVKLAGDEAQQGKAIRGLFKKEVYGDDESKRKEAQLRMKKELEMQMEEKKLKKQQDKLRIEEEERLENEKYNKFLEKEKIKKDEEERKEQENKRKKEMFTIQQAALLEEFKQTSNADRRSKAGKKLSITDVTSTQAGNNNTNGNTSNTVLNKGAVGASDRMSIQSNFNTNNTVYGQQPSTTNGYLASLEAHEIRTDSNFGGAAIRTNPNQSISPPTMPVDPINLNGYNPIEAQLNIYQRQFTPMTNFSNNDSVPIEKNLLENLIKENQGLKQEANRNTIIMDFLTNVLIKKQQNGSLMTASAVNQFTAFGPNPRTIEEPRTAEVYPSHQVRGQVGRPSNQPSTHHSKRKPYRINTPVSQQYPKSQGLPIGTKMSKPPVYQANGDTSLKKQKSSPTRTKPVNVGQAFRPPAGSSLLEEFQDLDNFKMIPQGPDNNSGYHYPDNEFDYDSGRDFRGQGDYYDEPWQDQYHEHNSSVTNRPQFRGAYTDSEAFDGNVLPHIGKNDIKARSEKYKFELASKLSKIRDELNVKDSKIDNLLHKIGINT